MLAIHARWLLTRANTVNVSQKKPLPQLTTPTRLHPPSGRCTTSGPPLSPWHPPRSPPRKPAHSSLPNRSRNRLGAALHAALALIGSAASIRMFGDALPGAVCPHPLTIAVAPAPSPPDARSMVATRALSATADDR